MNTLQTGILCLLRSGITGEKLILPENFSLEDAMPVLTKHSVAALAYQGAVNCALDQKDPVMQKLLMLYYRILMAHERQNLALEALFEAFSRAEIPYMPIKGCNLKKMYPKPELRPMGDADILIRLEDYEAIRSIMEQQGFSLKADTTHAFEWKKPGLLVELHKTMVDRSERDYFAYYGTGWQLAQKGEGSRYDLSPEDSYVFTVAHLAKHYRGSGVGCRHVVDLFVFQKSCPDLDMDYIARELKKLDLHRFHENVLRTLDVWFRDRETDAVTNLITDHIFSGGNWGSLKNKNLADGLKAAKQGAGRGISRFRLWIRTIFPPYEDMMYKHSALRRFPVLLPVFWVDRWLRLLLFRRNTIRMKVRELNKVDDDSVYAYAQALEMAGLTFEKSAWKEKG